jgi:hypothetical protein
LKNEGFFVFIGAAQSQGSCRRLFLEVLYRNVEAFFCFMARVYFLPQITQIFTDFF